MKIFYSLAFVLILFLGFSIHVSPVFATCPPDCTGSNEIPTDNEKTSTAGGTVSLNNPLPTSDIPTLIGQIIKGVLGVVGSLALVMFVYGGFTWMLAAGNSEAVKKGRDIIVWAAIGLVVIFTSYSLASFVLKAITGG